MFIESNLKELREMKGLSQGDLATALGMTRNMIASYETGTRPKLSEMLKIVDYFNISIDDFIRHNISEKGFPSPPTGILSDKSGIPLIVDVAAIAGFGNAHFSIQEGDIKDYYVIPEFKHKHIDFMIKVDGNSMYPNYNSGDIVACRIIRNRTFIQWNKTHVIATKEQGLIIKRITPGQNDDTYTIVSDNATFPEFQIPKSDIDGIALVVGVIRFE